MRNISSERGKQRVSYLVLEGDCVTERAKISIIVPVYGVEKYIENCIASLCAQTFGNLEILLIDDGSKDRSGQICDEWAKKDERIRVFHIENGGQSRARNVGLEKVTGDYIGFVDGDDMATPEMYEILLNLMIEHNAQIAECNFTGRKSAEPDVLEDGTLVEMCGREAIRKQLDLRESSRYPSTSLWSKLFKAELVKGLRLPEGRIHEEYGYLCEAFLRCENYVYTNQRLYIRTLRDDSTTAMKFSERALDKLAVFRNRNEFLKAAGEEEFYRLSKEQEYVLMLHYYGEACKAGMKDVAKRLKEDILLQKKDIRTSNLPEARKKQFRFFFFSPGIYALLKKVKA